MLQIRATWSNVIMAKYERNLNTDTSAKKLYPDNIPKNQHFGGNLGWITVIKLIKLHKNYLQTTSQFVDVTCQIFWVSGEI